MTAPNRTYRIRFTERCEPITAPSSAYEWQTFITARLGPAPAPSVNVAMVGKVRGAERYTVLPSLPFAHDIGHGLTFDSMREVRAHLRQAIVPDRTAPNPT